MVSGGPPAPPTAAIIDELPAGVVVVNRDLEVVAWNRFMAAHSGRAPETVLGRNIFECFPELPENWLRHKLRSVFVLRNRAFTSWEQRPYLFRFDHNRPITGGVDVMRQDCTFVPLRDEAGEVAYVSIVVFDMTDASIYQERLLAATRKLEEMSLRDGLTGAYNRRHVEAVLVTEFERAQRYDSPLTLVLLDIDHFKAINDTYGHPAGDQVLRHLVERIGHVIRRSDVLGRFGGEEFALVLPSTGLKGAVKVAERVRRDSHGHPVLHEGREIRYTVSLGLAALGPDIDSPETLVKRADEALYRAKARGRDRTVSHVSAGEPPSEPE